MSKSRNTFDGRVVQVELTERGRALQAELGAAGAEFFACTGLPAPQGDELIHTLHDLTDRLRYGIRVPEPDIA